MHCKTACRFLLIALLLLSGCERQTELPDFSAIESVDEKKQEFFRLLSPLVAAKNTEVLAERQRLLALYERSHQRSLDWFERNWLEDMKLRYGLADEDNDPSTWEKLLRRVDIVPPELALVQAAKESGWGTSRFVAEGFNFYGQRCFREGCGMIPQGAPNAGFEVARFDSIAASVYSYIDNLNTHPAYLPFRQLRSAQRQQGQELDAYQLAALLDQYSEERQQYLDDIRGMILANRDLIDGHL